MRACKTNNSSLNRLAGSIMTIGCSRCGKRLKLADGHQFAQFTVTHDRVTIRDYLQLHCTTMSATIRLKYLAPHRPHLNGGVIRVQAEDTICEVIESICESYPNLGSADITDLYKCSNFLLKPTDTRCERALTELAAGKFERLDEFDTVGEHFLANVDADRSDQLDVVIVPKVSFGDGIHTLAASEYDRFKKYQETFIKVSQHDKFEEGDVQLNAIQECPQERVPEFVANFKDLLTKQAIIPTEVSMIIVVLS
ncbi:hypothetical protein BC835DRAFT_635969 [Cytidiella melzeri]|nr:hypothetical protein BC835DRAFT_635969 [Cytidiella melzeri]